MTQQQNRIPGKSVFHPAVHCRIYKETRGALLRAGFTPEPAQTPLQVVTPSVTPQGHSERHHNTELAPNYPRKQPAGISQGVNNKRGDNPIILWGWEAKVGGFNDQEQGAEAAQVTVLCKQWLGADFSQPSNGFRLLQPRLVNKLIMLHLERSNK